MLIGLADLDLGLGPTGPAQPAGYAPSSPKAVVAVDGSIIKDTTA
jgi:hypothetical protein